MSLQMQPEGTFPMYMWGIADRKNGHNRKKLPTGFEPVTYALRVRRSTD